MPKKAKTATKAATAKKTAAPVKKAPAKKRVTFTLAAEVGREVYLAGDFNGWDPQGTKMTDKKGDGIYSATLMLAPGEYEYKVHCIADNMWCVDPNCKEWRQNTLGTLNSVLRV